MSISNSQFQDGKKSDKFKYSPSQANIRVTFSSRSGVVQIDETSHLNGEVFERGAVTLLLRYPSLDLPDKVLYAGNMGVFEYIGVLISVIMGLGITHLAVGASKLIQNRDTTKIYLPHVLWTINILLYTLMVWWSMFWWSALEDWSALYYLGITAYAIVLFLMSAMLYPYDMEKDIDIEAYFSKNRIWFFGLMATAWTLDIPETLGKELTGLRNVPPRYYIFVASMIGIAIVGILSSNKRVQLALPIAWFILLSSFISLAAVGVIDT